MGAEGSMPHAGYVLPAGVKARTVIVALVFIAFGTYFFTHPAEMMALFGVDPGSGADARASELVFRWLGMGPVGIGFFTLVVALWRGARRSAPLGQRPHGPGFLE